MNDVNVSRNETTRLYVLPEHIHKVSEYVARGASNASGIYIPTYMGIRESLEGRLQILPSTHTKMQITLLAH